MDRDFHVRLIIDGAIMPCARLAQRCFDEMVQASRAHRLWGTLFFEPLRQSERLVVRFQQFVKDGILSFLFPSGAGAGAGAAATACWQLCGGREPP